MTALKEVGYVTGLDDGFEERESVFLRDERGVEYLHMLHKVSLPMAPLHIFR